jgi:hypothetical protein
LIDVLPKPPTPQNPKTPKPHVYKILFNFYFLKYYIYDYIKLFI